jgi:phosphatidylserine/phosphatidylglycerophosphate/cardiolipin synthase-like enzyme
VFPAVEEAIGLAKSEVLLSLYAIAPDSIGGRLLSALCQAARRGVAVKFIVDDFGSLGSSTQVRNQLTAAGVAVTVFRPFWKCLATNPGHALHRTHARLLLIDRTLFGLGSLVFRQDYADRDDLFMLLEPENTDPILDFFRCLQSQAAPPAAAARAIGGGMKLVTSAPDPPSRRIYRWALSACRRARRRIWIATPFFCPPRGLLNALEQAAGRGVDIRIFTPLRPGFHGDLMRALPLPGLISRGAAKWYACPRYFHWKFCIADDRWMLGSANFDLIGIERNFELNVCAEGGPTLEDLEALAASLAATASRTTPSGSLRVVRVLAPLIYRAAVAVSALT